MAPNKTFDYVIIGAGSAGCVLANRLTENPSVTVLLIEAGGVDRNIFIHMPAAFAMAARNPALDWAYLSEPEPNCDNRQIHEHRGRVLGGSSSINGMVANRGNPLDYDGWAAEGLTDWSYAACLPYFRKLESSDKGTSHWRGGEGPQSIETCKADHPLNQAFLQAGQQAGYAYTEDQNGQQHEGIHVAQSFTKNGRRHSAARAWLYPAMARPNLTVMTHTLAEKIEFDGRRAVAVHTLHKGQPKRYEADREVILSGGAINSPQLLLLSGVGPKAHLAEHTIPLIADLPAVGQNLENHVIAAVAYDAPNGVSLAHQLNGWRKYRVGLQWLLFKTGIGASTMCETGCFFKSSGDVAYADLQHEFYALTSLITGGTANFGSGFMFSMGLMRPESRGSVTLKSGSPLAKPALVYNFLQAPGDQQAMINGVRRTRVMAAQQAFDGLRTTELEPGGDVQSDAEILDWLRATASTEFHPSSTCRMGTGDNAVTDGQGRVHTLDGLRVIDASIMPHNVTANLNAPVLMLAEKLAEVIKAGP